MTIASHDFFAVSRPFPAGTIKPVRFEREFIVVALVSLFGLTVSVLALLSGATAELGDMAAFLG